MSTKHFQRLFLLIFIVSISFKSFAQNPINWTSNQLMEPTQLAQAMQAGKALPVILSVGPGALIPHSIAIGPVQEEANLDKLKKQLSTFPKDTAIVVYCGCCPFEHCPNVRPAIAALKEMKFTNYKLLNLSHNIKADWLDKGYPSTKL